MSMAFESDWTAQNQDHLMAELDRVRAALERHLGRVPATEAEASPDRRRAAETDESGALEGAPATSSIDGDSLDTSMGETSALAPTLAEESPDPPAVERLASLFRLSQFETDLLLLCAGVELDAGLAALCREAGGRPGVTFSLSLAVLPGAHWSALTPAAPLRYWKMIELGPGDALVTAPLRIDERILHYLAGVGYTDERLLGVTRPYRVTVEFPVGLREPAKRIDALWSASGDGPWPTVQLVGEEDAGLVDAAAAACALQGLNLRLVRGRDIPANAAEREQFLRIWEREAALTGCGLLVTIDDTDGAGTAGAVAAFVDRSQGVLLLAGREPLRLPGRTLPRFDIRKPTGSEQAALWRQSLAPLAEQLKARTSNDHGLAVERELHEQIDRLVNQFNMGYAAIASAAAAANSFATREADHGSEAAAKLLWDTCRGQARARLDDLAQRNETNATWDDLVLPAPQKQILQEIVTHVRQRVQVYDRWGFAAKSSRGLGISALFAGPSGTGKTLAGEILANELHLDLYRIDLSQVVSKYIGETEKNLRRVFDAAETAGAVLLFDEADSLFGKRSEVKDSHDRYANIEVSYLLQRMEGYRGLAILTTNMKQALDPAFARRIRFVVQFPFPDMAERAEIWRRIFPSPTPTEGLDVDRLARLNVAGGNIRNIAMGTAFLAADEERPVTMAHLLHAARAEYAKLERPLTDAEIAGWV